MSVIVIFSSYIDYLLKVCNKHLFITIITIFHKTRNFLFITNIYRKCKITRYIWIFQYLFFIKLLCFKIELKFISLKIERIGFFNTLFIAVWIKLSSPIKIPFIIDLWWWNYIKKCLFIILKYKRNLIIPLIYI